MTWTPRVGDWLVLSEYQNGETLAVVDGVDHDVGGPRFWLVDTAGEQQGYVIPYNLETFCRPATIDEIPGNTVGEEEHDEALFEAGHGALAACNSTTAALWEWLAIGLREHVKPGRLGHEDWP